MPTQLKSRCPHCQAVVKFSDTLVGKRVRCPSCKQAFELSSVQSASGSAIETAPSANETFEVAAADTRPVLEVPESVKSRVEGMGLGKLGRFELKELLGQGAYGRVYRAYDPQLDREVALKVPIFGPEDKHKIQRFSAEAKAAAKLRHPNIVPTYESGQIGAQYYIAAQFVAGQTLACRIEQNRPDYRQAAEWVRQLANALAYAHAAGIVHRDIKPENIILDEQGVPHIMDFGLAKRVNEDSAMTTDGSVLGTPAYMAPEQARGELSQVGPHSDQYSLGVVLYQLLTGKKPFEGAPHSVIAKVIAVEPPSPRSLNRDIPEDLESICEIAMNKIAADRYPSCAEFGDDVARWLGGYETEARPLSGFERGWRWCRRNALVAGLTAAVVLLLTFGLVTTSVLVWTFSSRGEQIVTSRSSIETSVAEASKSLTVPGSSASPSTSSDAMSLKQNALDFFHHIGADSAHVELFSITPTEPLTVELVATSRSLGTDQQVITPLWIASGQVGARLVLKETKDVWCWYAADKGESGKYDMTTHRGVGLGKPTHLAGVSTGTELRLYVDGVLRNKQRIATQLPTNAVPMTFGAKYGFPFDGTIEEARISKIARYESDFIPQQTFENDSNTLALYHFDEGHGDVLIDSSGNGRHGKIFGAEWVVQKVESSLPSPAATTVLKPESAQATATTNEASSDSNAGVAPATAGYSALDFFHRVGTDLAYVDLFPIVPNEPLTVELYATCRSDTAWSTKGSSPIWSTRDKFVLCQNILRQKEVVWSWGFRYNSVPRSYETIQVADIVPGKRVHLAGIVTGTELRFFVDGRLRGKKRINEQLSTVMNNTTFGARWLSPPNQPFDGTIDEARISKIARYDTDFIPPSIFANDADTLALYHFDDGRGDILTDSSGNGRHGKIHGAKWVVQNGDLSPVYRPSVP